MVGSSLDNFQSQSLEMLVIGRLAPRWNVPIIAHMSGDDILSDRAEFPTLGSVALTSASEMARATLSFIQLNNWDQARSLWGTNISFQLGFVRPSRGAESLSLHSLNVLLKDNPQLKINTVIEIDPFASADEIIASGKLKQLNSQARSECTAFLYWLFCSHCFGTGNGSPFGHQFHVSRPSKCHEVRGLCLYFALAVPRT